MTSRIAHKIEAKSRTGDVVINENVDFTGLLLSEKVLDGLKNGGFVRPSPIQLKAIPLGRCGLDLIVQAKSGTGKTCVFTVIALEGLQCESTATQVLVLAPTREIAVQIYDVVKTIGSAIPALEVATFIGGMPLQEDKQKLKKCHVAVGTPGRIKQLIERKLLNTDNIRLFVLDEADKLLEESFQEQINWIYSTLPNNKQILALSATYPTYLDEHLTKYMRNPTFIRLNVSDPALLGIKQYYVEVPFSPSPVQLFEQKASVVSNLLSSVSFHQCLIFSNLQTMAQNLSDLLNNEGWPTTCIAGCLEQTDRLEAMEKLKSYKCRVLISTDLTARGIDAERVNIVINLDVPRDHETYLHRIGRAGRFGSFGAAVTVVSKGQEESDLKSVERKCKTSIKCLPDPVPSDLLKSDPVLLSEFVSTEQIVTRTEDESIGIHSSEFSLGKSEHCGMDDGDIVNRYNPVTHEMSELALTDNTNSHDLPKCNGVNHYDSSNESEKSLSDNRKDVPMSIAGDSEGKDSENQASIEKFQINTDTFHEQQFNDQNNFETYACHTGCNEAGEQLKKVESVSIEASGCKYKVEHLSSSDMETSSSSHVSEKDTIVNENLHGSPALKNISTSEVSETSQSRNSSSSQKKIDSPIRTPRKKKQNHPRSLSYWLNQLNENNQTQNTMSESNFSNLPSSDVGKDQMSSDNVSRGSVSLLPIVSQMESIPDLVSAPVDIERYSKTLPNVNSIGNISNNAVNAVSFQKNSNTEESSNISTHKMFDHASDEKECVIKDQNTIATISPDSCDGKIQSPKEPVSIIAPDPSVNKKSASLKSEKCESNECISYENFSHSSSASIAQPFDVSCQRIVSHYNPEPHMNLNNSPEKTDLQSYLTTDCSEVSKNNDSQNTKEKESAEKSNRSALAYNDLDIFDSNFTEVETPKNKKYNRKNKNPGKRKSAKKPVNPEQTYDDMLKEYAQKRNSELQEIDNIQNKNTSPSRGSDTSGRKIIKANRSNVKSEVKTEQAIDENYNGSTLTVEKKICTSLEHDTSSSYSVDNYLCPLSAHVSLGVNTLSRIDTYSDVCKDFEQYLSNNSQSQQKMFKEPDLTNIICPQQSDNNSYNKTVRLQIKQIIDSAYDEYFNTSKCTQKSQKTDDNSCKFISTENSEQPNICTETSDIEFTKNYSSSATSPSLKRETLELTASEFHTEITGKSVVVTKPGFVSESEKTTRTQVYTAVPGFQRDLCATQTSTCPSTDKCEHYIIKDTVKKNSMKNSTCIDMGTNTDDHLFLSWVKKYKIQNVPLERVKLNMDGKEINIMEPLTIDTNLCSGSDDSLCSITPDAVEYDEFIYTDGEKQKYTKFPKNSDGMKYTAKPKSLSKNTEKIKNSSQRASKVTNEFQNGNSKMKEKKNINHSNATKQPPDKTCDKMHSRSSSRNKAKDNYKEAWNAESAVFHDFPFYPHSQSFPDYANNYYTTNTKSQQSLEQWEKKASRQHRQTHHSVSNHWSDWWERYKEFYMQYYDYYQMVTGWSNNHLDFVENSQQTYNMQWKYQNMMKN